VHCSGFKEEYEKNGRTFKVTNLRMPKTGAANTEVIELGPHCQGYCQATRNLSLLSNIFFFRRFPPLCVSRLLDCVMEETRRKSDVIIRQNDKHCAFFIIIQGRVAVCDKEKELFSLENGDSFGESIFLADERLASHSFVAKTAEVDLLLLPKRSFFSQVEHTCPYLRELQQDIVQLHQHRDFIRDCLIHSHLFSHLSVDQIAPICSAFEEPLSLPSLHTIFRQGEIDRTLFIVRSGSVRIVKCVEGMEVELMKLGPGGSFGEMALMTGQARSASAVTDEPTVLFVLKRERFLELLNRFQNLRFQLTAAVEQRVRETQEVSRHVANRSHSASPSPSPRTSLLDVLAAASVVQTPK